MADGTTAQPPAGEPRRNGWLIAGFVVVILCIGGLTAAVVSKGDSGSSSNTLPPEALGTVSQARTTTVQHNVTVTAPPNTVTVQPEVTVQVPTTGTTTGERTTPTATTP